MLKRLIVNQKIIPVPVPLKTLAEVCSWVDETLVDIGETVTSATIDGKDVLDYWGLDKVCSSITMHSEMRLELRIESPEDLAFQTLDTIHALSGSVLGGLKVLAVHLWQSRKNDLQPELSTVVTDTSLICELIERLRELSVTVGLEIGALLEILGMMYEIKCRLERALMNGDWREAAQILLRDSATNQGLETILKRVILESEIAHEALLSIKSSQRAGLGTPAK